MSPSPLQPELIHQPQRAEDVHRVTPLFHAAALHRAAAAGDGDVVTFLLLAGADPDLGATD